jgi:hypothetical protein
LPSGIRDNYHRGTVGHFLKEKIQAGSTLSIVSAYFTIYAFEKLKDPLAAIEGMRFLFGEPRFVSSLADKADKKAFKIEEDGLQLAKRLEQKRVARECAEWIMAKAEIKSVKQSGLLHGKLYHIAHAEVADAILGSSNFTVHGLGLGESGNNIELNMVVDSNRDLHDLKAWFDEIWNDDELVEDVKAEVLHYLAQLYQNNAPEFIYFKTLFHLFERYLADQTRAALLDEKTHLVDTDIWKALFEFQKDGVKGAINKILTYNGCILADSVGLGKTYEALAVTKYFELLNYKVLVLCPKKLRENWTVYQAQNNSELNPFVRDRFAYTVLSHTDLSRDGGKSGDIDLAAINWGNYDLVVIDESHNFRNNTRGKRNEDGSVARKSRYERLMEDIIQSGIKTRVLLLSATPVNNDLKDLRNQIYFITEGRDDAFRDAFGMGSIQETLRVAQQEFNQWAKKSRERNTAELLEGLSSAFFKLLDELTIARSRKHILRYYKDTIAQLGGFPERLKPVSVYPAIDLKGRFMSYDKLNDEISQYQLALFNPSKYILPEHRAYYEAKSGRLFSQADRENYLIGMMKVNFLKRLESSVRSFAITMERTVNKIENLEERIQRFKQLARAHGGLANPPLSAGSDDPAGAVKSLDLSDLQVEAQDDEELRDALEVGEKFVFQMAHLDVGAWLEDLGRDKQQLSLLQSAAENITPQRDAKLAELVKLIEQKVKHPTTNKLGQPNRKVLVFTAFADTAVYLYDALLDWATHELGIHLAMVSGGAVENRTTFGKNEFNNILINFSPVAKRRAKMKTMPQEGEIDLLIATDCISEGQNLQDCDYVVNYDIHWNPVRVIQRFGRIDRIGSICPTVQLVNFWPTQDLDKYITLKNRVEARMALVDIAATLEDNILKPELTDMIGDELRYRDKQLLRLKDEVLDLEDFSESVTLNEFTLDDFRIELLKYIEANRKQLEEAPLGLYAVVPPDAEYPVIKPGVIFCLRQKGDSSGSETVNPLQPYFLVYVRDDKEVRFSFAQPKQILEMYRTLCVGKATPYEELCDLFDEQTHNGADMGAYNELLKRAVSSIVGTYKRRVITGLLAGRGGKVVEQDKQATESTDFELVTWLVIK